MSKSLARMTVLLMLCGCAAVSDAAPNSAAKPLRANAGPNEHGLVNGFNEIATARFAGAGE